MPLTSSGETDRSRLPPPATLERLTAQDPVPPRTATERVLVEVWGKVLRLTEVSVEDRFMDLGGTSLLLVEVRSELRRRLGRDIEIGDLFQYPTIRAHAARLDAIGPDPAEDARSERTRGGTADIAIVGLALRVPGAADVETFWHNLVNGVESAGPLPGAADGQRDPRLATHPDFVPAGAPLPDIDRFDAAFFALSRKEAELLDPQQRVFLECAWEALESAGYAPGGRIGVFAGCGMSTYLINNLAPHFGYGTAKAMTESDLEQFQLKLGNDGNHLATRVSHALDLRGPSVGVQTACSTSLVAVHLACRSLLDGESDMALAGGVHIVVPQNAGYVHEAGMIMSADGHTRTFDADASGTLFGDGCGVVVLKRLADAQADGDRIIAVVKGSAVNNDGAEKISFTAPSVGGQAEVNRTALGRAGADPSEVTYLEAHGTGTHLGDPIEMSALGQVFGRRPDEAAPRFIGSLKTNVGHLDEVAGVAGLIKAALCEQRGMLVPSLHYDRPNPEIDFGRSPFRVSADARAWETGDLPRTAGVTSLGVGGANAHVIIQQAPPPETRPEPPRESTPETRSTAAPARREPGLLVISARTDAALAELTERYAAHLRSVPAGTSLTDVCSTAALGRRHFPRRRAVVAGGHVPAGSGGGDALHQDASGGALVAQRLRDHLPARRGAFDRDAAPGRAHLRHREVDARGPGGRLQPRHAARRGADVHGAGPSRRGRSDAPGRLRVRGRHRADGADLEPVGVLRLHVRLRAARAALRHADDDLASEERRAGHARTGVQLRRHRHGTRHAGRHAGVRPAGGSGQCAGPAGRRRAVRLRGDDDRHPPAVRPRGARPMTGRRHFSTPVLMMPRTNVRWKQMKRITGTAIVIMAPAWM
ncbi:beta-ketoacyl synthase N-terminal-like domain-containing protein [Spongiactinospora sp. TRM90649]|uniref:beta-ketoacyl synthase N-terminal-like domain-containing protein n=1 Tax=Spongiactinospora sp. TRM90649 TaxID=3031114 RepID=UPI003211A852